MKLLLLLTWTSGAYPLWRAWVANRTTSLWQTIPVAILAWLAWHAALAAPSPLSSHIALSLTACAGVAVLGARRPAVGAWSVVVGGLFLVFLMPVAEGLGDPRPSPLQRFFLGGSLVVMALNYLPTRLGGAAILLAVGCAGEAWAAWYPSVLPEESFGLAAARWCLVLGPWAGLHGLTRSRPAAEFDRHWLDFRDRYGLLWAQRVREQFNRVAANAGWPVTLYWEGLRRRSGSAALTPEEQEAIVEGLRGLTGRFLDERQEAQRGPRTPPAGPVA